MTWHLLLLLSLLLHHLVRSYVGTAYPGEVPLDRDEAATRVQSAFRGMQVRRNS